MWQSYESKRETRWGVGGGGLWVTCSANKPASANDNRSSATKQHERVLQARWFIQATLWSVHGIMADWKLTRACRRVVWSFMHGCSRNKLKDAECSSMTAPTYSTSTWHLLLMLLTFTGRCFKTMQRNNFLQPSQCLEPCICSNRNVAEWFLSFYVVSIVMHYHGM